MYYVRISFKSTVKLFLENAKLGHAMTFLKIIWHKIMHLVNMAFLVCFGYLSCIVSACSLVAGSVITFSFSVEVQVFNTELPPGPLLFAVAEMTKIVFKL